jgi:hypothetical protein
MSEIERIPTIVVHQINNGGNLTGTLPDGTDSDETLRRGRIRYYAGCTDGGKFELPDALVKTGFRVERVAWNLPGLTGVNLYVVDPNGFAYLVGTMTGAQGFYEWRNGGTLVPGYSGWSFAAIKTGGANLTADGSIMFVVGQGWGQATLSEEGSLGREAKPPSMQRA